jgi:hypothetical protein
LRIEELAGGRWNEFLRVKDWSFTSGQGCAIQVPKYMRIEASCFSRSRVVVSIEGTDSKVMIDRSCCFATDNSTTISNSDKVTVDGNHFECQTQCGNPATASEEDCLGYRVSPRATPVRTRSGPAPRPNLPSIDVEPPVSPQPETKAFSHSPLLTPSRLLLPTSRFVSSRSLKHISMFLVSVGLQGTD